MLRRLAVMPVVVALLACGAATASAASGWAIQPTPNPSNGHFNALTAVSCTTTSACVAGGTIGGEIGLSEVWNGSTWRLQPVAPVGSAVPALLAMSCPAAATCMAATGLRVTEHWNGTAWAIEHLAKPAPSYTSFEMPAVSCASATDCTGFGAYTANRTCTGVAEIWNGSSWAVQATVPGGCGRSPCRNAANNCGLASISCPTTTSCMAVGHDVAEFWNGSTWTSEPFASPGGGRTPALAAVSCTAADDCTAVGQAGNHTSTKTLAEYWNGTTWAIQPTPSPAGQQPPALAGVSCRSAANCTAVGNSSNATGVLEPLAEHWNGTGWTIQPAPSPSGSTGTVIDGVSCPAAAHCTATGQAFAGTGSNTLAEAR
jgi:hypothetical protein